MNILKKVVENNNLIREWISLGPNLILVLSGSSELEDDFKTIPTASYSLFSELSKNSLSSIKSVTASYALNYKPQPVTPNTNSNNTTLVTAGKYPITSSWSEKSIHSFTSSYISGSLFITGRNGFFPMYENSTLSSESSILDKGTIIYINKPVHASNLPVTSSNSSTQLSLVTDKYIPVFLNGVLHKIALVK